MMIYIGVFSGLFEVAGRRLSGCLVNMRRNLSS
jgi:hypothetical protein